MSIYDSASVGTNNNKVTFNNFAVTPVFRMISTAPQRRQIRDLDIPIPFESGISDFLTLIGETAYVLEGIMYPGGESEYDTGKALLRKVASLDIAQEDPLSDDGYVPYVWTEFTRQKQVFLKVLYVDMQEDTRKGLVQPFRLICKVKDPVIYAAIPSTASTQGTDPTISAGTALFPFTYPIIYGSSTFSVTSTATNEGDLPTYPTGITVVGPVNNPQVVNSQTGEFIQVNTNLASSSDTLNISYDKDTLIVEKNGVSVLDLVSSESTYFKLISGANPIILNGSTIGSGAYVSVGFRSAWPLS